MLWSRTQPRRLDAEVEKRLALARQNNPAGETWLALVEAALAETANVGRWRAAIQDVQIRIIECKGARLLNGFLSEGGRRCHQRQQPCDNARAVRRFVRHLTDLVALNGEGPDHIDPVGLVEAAIRQDDARIGESSKLRVVAQIAAVPLLVAAAQAIGGAISAAWWEGYCPVCGAWPTLAEFRGLERKRWLRCGRCATAWELPWLRCAFCGETDHEHLGYLAPEEGETSRKVEVCDTCKGYLKAEPTVSALPWCVVLDDAATVVLDVAALDRGYHRPERPGFGLDVRIVPDRSGFWTT